MASSKFPDFRKCYGEGAARTEVLADMNLSIADGEFVAIVGFSGSARPR